MVIEDEALTAYLDELVPPRDALLLEMEAYAREHHVPIVGPRVGALLRLLARTHDARRALELGTAIGYSGIWIAGGLGAGGTLTTVEGREEVAVLARQNLAKAGLDDQVEVIVGRAQEVVAGLDGPFDFIFNDIDKEGYPTILPHCKALLRPGGLLVTDNVLWSGRVTDSSDQSEATEAIREYNRRIAADREMESVILPLRDGVSVARIQGSS